MSFFTSRGHVYKISDTQTIYYKRVSLEKVTGKAFPLPVIPLLSLRGEGKIKQQPNLSLIEPDKESKNHS